MSDRFNCRYRLNSPQYTANSPVLLSTGVLWHDMSSDRQVIQLKLKNVSSRAINTVHVKIQLFNKNHTPIQKEIEYIYDNLSAQHGGYFGDRKAIIINVPTARSFQCTQVTVTFEDDTTTTVQDFRALPDSTTLFSSFKENKLTQLYQQAVNASANYSPQEANGLWQCTCGEWNDAQLCTRCNANKDVVFSNYKKLLPVLKEPPIKQVQTQPQTIPQIKDAPITQKKLNKQLIAVLCTIVIISIVVAAVTLGGNEGSRYINKDVTNNAEDENVIEIAYVEVDDIGTSGYRDYHVFIRNISDEVIHSLNLSITSFNEYDEKVRSSNLQDTTRVLPGQTIVIDNLTRNGISAYMTIDSCAWKTEDGSAHEYNFGRVKTIPLTDQAVIEFEGETSVPESPIQDDIVLSDEEVSLTVEQMDYLSSTNGFKRFSVIVSNNTNMTLIDPVINMIVLDENGNIIDTLRPKQETKLRPGSSVTFVGATNRSDAQYFTVDGYTYTSLGQEEVTEFFPTIPKAVPIN